MKLSDGEKNDFIQANLTIKIIISQIRDKFGMEIIVRSVGGQLLTFCNALMIMKIILKI